VLLTYAAVLLAQIFFRATGIKTAVAMLAGMAGLHRGPLVTLDTLAYHPSSSAFLGIALAYFIVWALPNTQQILARFKPALELAPSDREMGRLHWFWRPTPAWGLALGVIFLAVLVKMENPTTFLYFQF
jgi:alginate O-acetyltransferase complex protein AlgI